MTLRTLAIATGLSLLAATASLAKTVKVTVGGDLYEVTTIEGTFTDKATYLTLEDQVWWGNEALARDFSRAVLDKLGTPWEGKSGPVFAIGTALRPDWDSTTFTVLESVSYSPHTNTVYEGVFPIWDTTSYPWATATLATSVPASPVPAVPLPAGGLLLLSGLGGVAALKRRKKRAA